MPQGWMPTAKVDPKQAAQADAMAGAIAIAAAGGAGDALQEVSESGVGKPPAPQSQ